MDADEESRDAIRAVIDAVARAVHEGDADAIVAHMTDDVVVFDVIGPLSGTGKALAREQARDWLAIYVGPVLWEDHDVRIDVSGDVAFSHALSRVRGALRNGRPMDLWFRSTLGFRRIDGRWRVAHNHGSVPFDPTTGDALVGLRP